MKIFRKYHLKTIFFTKRQQVFKELNEFLTFSLFFKLQPRWRRQNWNGCWLKGSARPSQQEVSVSSWRGWSWGPADQNWPATARRPWRRQPLRRWPQQVWPLRHNNFSAYQLFSKISCPESRFWKMYYPWLPESRRINKLAPLLLCWIPVHIYTSSVRKKNFRILFEWSRNHPSSSPVWDNEASEERPEKSLCIPQPEAISGVLKVDSRAMTFNISSNIFLEQFPWSDCSSKIKILTKNPYIDIF